MPLASKYSHGIVKIGDGLNVTTDGLLTVDFNSDWYSGVKLDISNLRVDVDALSVNVNSNNDEIVKLNDYFEKLRTNVIPISPISGGFRAGNGASGSGVAIGGDTLAGGSCVAVGEDASASVFSTALGSGAVAYGSQAVQLGRGSNYEPGTLQFRKFNIVSKDGKLYTNLGTESEVNMGMVASEQYVKDLLKTVTGGGLSLQVVDMLPTENISTSTIYLVPNDDGTYDEYVYVNEKWEQIGTTEVDLSNYVTLEEYNKLVNNETQIAGEYHSFKAGGASSAGYYAVSIGSNAVADAGGVAIGQRAKSHSDESVGIGKYGSGANGGVAIGNYAQAGADGLGAITGAEDCVSIGHDARSHVNKAIQLGYGTNNTASTLQIFNDNIYNHNTHTLTVQNIEQNGNKVYGVLQGETAPTTETVGEVGQFYIDTVAKALYHCTAVTTDETAGTTAYEWQGVGGVSQEDFDKLVNNETQIKTSNSSFKAGNATRANKYGVAIGHNAVASSNSVSVGPYTEANETYSSAFGFSAKAGSYALALGYRPEAVDRCVQIGYGKNSTQYTLQVYNDNIYNWDTHTLTVQNIELNGVDLGTQLGDLNTALETILGV